MSIRNRIRPYLPRVVRRLPADLAVVLVVVAVTVLAVSLPVVRDTPLRAVVSVPFLLFVPGYAFVAAVFPAGREVKHDSTQTPRRTLSDVERLTLSVASSVAIVALLGFVLTNTPWGFQLIPMLVSLTVVTVVAVAVAVRRRWALPADERYAVAFEEWRRTVRTEFLRSDTRGDWLLNVALAAVLLVATASVGYALVDQQYGERYTELYLLSDGRDGPVAENYPSELTATESRSLLVGVRNHEHERTSYTIVTELQRVQSDGEETVVVEEEQLDRFGLTLASNESRTTPRVLTPTLVGDRLRLQFLLYRGDAPADPNESNAYRTVHLWVNVTASES